MSNHAATSHRFVPGRVGDCMRPGILSCPAESKLSAVADLMDRQRVHAIALTGDGGGRPVAIISDLDLIAAALSGEDSSALRAAATEPVTISSHESLGHAAQLMAEHEVSHLVVLDRASGYPTGIISTSDLVGAYAHAERRS